MSIVVCKDKIEVSEYVKILGLTFDNRMTLQKHITNIYRSVNLHIRKINIIRRLQTTQPTSGGVVTADSSCCENCVEPPRPQQWGPDLPFLGMCYIMRWMAGAAAHKSG